MARRIREQEPEAAKPKNSRRADSGRSPFFGGPDDPRRLLWDDDWWRDGAART